MRPREPFDTDVNEADGVDDVKDGWEGKEDMEVMNFEDDKLDGILDAKVVVDLETDSDEDTGVVVMVADESAPIVTVDDGVEDELVTDGNGKVDVAAASGELKEPIIPSRLGYSEFNN